MEIADFLIPFVVFSVCAYICTKLSRPFFLKRWSRILSQIIATVLLFFATAFAKKIGTFSVDPSGKDDNILFIFFLSILVMKFVSMYLIACYARSVGRNPFWAFLGVLNFGMAIGGLVYLWVSKPRLDR